MPTRARDRLLDTAEELFYANGIGAVGIEWILSESGVGRASLYRHFPGKDDLVVAVLERRDEQWRDWLASRVEALGGHPLDVFGALAERFERADFRGCAFINTMVETADAGSPAFEVAQRHKASVQAYVASLLSSAGFGDPAQLAERLVLLMDGAIVTALRTRTTTPAHNAREIADGLLCGRR